MAASSPIPSTIFIPLCQQLTILPTLKITERMQSAKAKTF